MNDDEVVRFVKEHESSWQRAFLGYSYNFTAPELSKAPFQARRLNRLVREGRLRRAGEAKGERSGKLEAVR